MLLITTLKTIIKGIIPYGIVTFIQKIRSVAAIAKGRLMKNGHNNMHMNNVVITLSHSNTSSNENIAQISYEGINHPIFLRNDTSDVLVYKSILDNNEYGFCVKEPPKIVIDAGANIGLTSVFFANKYPDAKIFAIEPEESNIKILEKNIAAYKNISLIQAALWDSEGEISLLDPGIGNWGFMVGSKHSKNEIVITDVTERHLTRAITIERILKDYNISHIDILKLDIEGSEKEIFESCDLWIDKVDCIIVELHERMKRGCEKAFRRIVKKFDKCCKDGENFYLVKNDYLNIN